MSDNPQDTPPLLSRTMGDIAKRYNEKRDAILERIRKGEISASMSNIEYYPKPWDELDISDPHDAMILAGTMTWDGQRHSHEGFRKFTQEELDLRGELSALMWENMGPDRNAKMRALREKIHAARTNAFRNS